MNKTRELSVLRKMAKDVYALCYEDIPEETRRHVKICVMDALECCLSSENDERKKGTFAAIDAGEHHHCTLYGTKEKASVQDAAFYNTVSGAISYRNDIYMDTRSHPGSVVIPAVLALAEQMHLDGKTTMCSIVAGYESMIRLGNMLRAGHFSNRFRPTGFAGPIGCALAAAKAAGLDEEAMIRAASLAFNCAAGINEWAVAGTGEDVIQNGFAARSGIICMQLARGGVPAAEYVVEGDFGFLCAYGMTGVEEAVINDREKHFFVGETQFKQLPACVNVQNAAQTAALMKKEYHLVPENITDITVEMSKNGKEWMNADKQIITGVVEAKMSVPFAVAAAFACEDLDSICWDPPYDRTLHILAERCRVLESKTFTEDPDKEWAVRITITLDDGKSYTMERTKPDTLTEDEAANLFFATASAFLSAEQAKKMVSGIGSMEMQQDMAPLLRLLSTGTGQGS